MSSTLQQNIPEAAKAQAEGQLAVWANLNGTLLSSMAELAELNMEAAKESINESMALFQELLGSKNIQDVFAVSAHQLQPNMDRISAYSRHMAGIAAGVRADILKAAQAEMAELNQQTALLMEGLFKQPAGDANPFAGWMKNALDATNAGYEQVLGASMNMAEHMGALHATESSKEKPNGRAHKK